MQADTFKSDAGKTKALWRYPSGPCLAGHEMRIRAAQIAITDAARQQTLLAAAPLALGATAAALLLIADLLLIRP